MNKLRHMVCLIALAGCVIAVSAINYPPENTAVTFLRTNLPIVFINTGATEISRTERITATMLIINNPTGLNYPDTIAYPNQHVDYRGYIGLRYRGTTSFENSPKKPYSIHTLTAPYDRGGKKRKASLLGMPAENKWALLAAYSDKSLMRDMLAFQLARNYLPYAPDGRHCELILDGTYYGVYILSELNTKGESRLDLPDPGESGDALTGGYYIGVDRQSDPHFRSAYRPRYADGTPYERRSIFFVYNWPDFEDLSTAQQTYIQSAVKTMEDAINAPDFADPDTGYARYINVNSFVDYMLSTEFSHNVDGYRLSTGLFKRRDSDDPRFHATIWDQNLGFGNANYYEGYRTDTWIFRNNDLMIPNGEIYLIPFWWQRLLQDPAFGQRLLQRWRQYRREVYRTDHIMAVVDSIAGVLTADGAVQRNFDAWKLYNRHAWPNHYVAPDFQAEVTYLKKWITDRLGFIDNHLPDLLPMPHGDLNGDHLVDIGDLNSLINILLARVAPTSVKGNPDLDHDGKTDINDINVLLNLLLQ